MSIRKRGNTYQFTVDIGKDESGKRKRISKGGFKTKAECEKAEKLFIYELENRKCKFDTVAKEYLTTYVSDNLRVRTLEIYSNYYYNHICKAFGDKYVDKITVNDVYLFLSDISKNYSKDMLKGIKGLLGAIFNYCIYPKELIATNPVKFVNIAKFNAVEHTEKVLTKNDINNIIEYLKAKNSPYLIVILIMYHTGVRASECLGLQWSDIDFNNNIIHITKQLGRNKQLCPPKTKAGVRDINFTDSLKQELLKQRERHSRMQIRHDFVCTRNDGGFITHTNLNQTRYYIDRDVCAFKYHAIRTLHCTMLIESGAPIKDISRRLGHSNTAMTLNVYTKCTQAMSNETLNILEKIIGDTI